MIFCCCGGGGPCTVARTFSVTGCGGPEAGATVSVTSAGVTTTGTTAAGGQVTLTGLSPGSYTYSVAKTRYATAAGSFTIASTCLPATGTITVPALSPAAGYKCLCFCTTPVSTTLHLTDPVAGAVTLTFNSGTGIWEGTKAGSYGVKYHNDRHDGRTTGPAIPIGDTCATPDYSNVYTLGAVGPSGTCALKIVETYHVYLWSDFGFGPECALYKGPSGTRYVGNYYDTFSNGCTTTPVLTIVVDLTATAGGTINDDFYNSSSNPGWVWPTPVMSPPDVTFLITE